MRHLPQLKQMLRNASVLTPYLLGLVLIMQGVSLYQSVETKSYAENSDYLCSATNDQVDDISDELSSLRREVSNLQSQL